MGSCESAKERKKEGEKNDNCNSSTKPEEWHQARTLHIRKSSDSKHITQSFIMTSKLSEKLQKLKDDVPEDEDEFADSIQKEASSTRESSPTKETFLNKFSSKFSTSTSQSQSSVSINDGDLP